MKIMKAIILFLAMVAVAIICIVGMFAWLFIGSDRVFGWGMEQGLRLSMWFHNRDF